MKKTTILLSFLTLIFSSLTFAEKLDGKEIAFDRKKGNCLACHQIAGGELAGTLGPPLLLMKIRFPNKADLRARIYDATEINPITAMPPFGKYGILSDAEIDAVTDYIHNL